MADRELKENVIVDGVLYVAGSKPPKDVADRITAPSAWAGEVSEEKSKDAPSAQAGSEKPAPTRRRRSGSK